MTNLLNLPGCELQTLASGLQVLAVNTPLAKASIALQGGHVLAWQPVDCAAPVLWMSPQARFEPGRAIRGGIPVCWPWFGPYSGEGQQPAHGYARTAEWLMKDVQNDIEGNIFLTLQLDQSAAPLAAYANLSLQLELRIGKTLQLTLTTRNDGASAVRIGEALHTYFQISDIGNISVAGLDRETYWDTVGEVVQKTQQGAIRFDQETDRVYIHSAATAVIEDPVLCRCIHITKQGSFSTVVWNPWTAKAERMGDLGQPAGWRGFVCVETANAWDNCIDLASGETHQMRVEYRVEHDACA